MKKVLALLLVMLMAMSVLVACGDDKNDNKKTDDNDKVTKVEDVAEDEDSNAVEKVPAKKELTADELIGDWEMTVGFYDFFEGYLDMMGEDAAGMEALLPLYEAMLENVDFKIDITFSSNNKYTAKMSTEAAAEIKDQIIDNTLDYLSNGGIVEVMAMQGYELTYEEIEENIANQGMTMDEYYEAMADQMSESLDVESLAGNMDEAGDYELTSSTLWIDMDDEDMDINSTFNYKYTGSKITLVSQVDGESHPFTGAVLTKK